MTPGWRGRAAAVALLAVLSLAFDARAGTRYDGRVVEIVDGDTIEVLVDGAPPETLRIRLAGIDTPERGQPFARRARQALAKRVGGKVVRVNGVATDRYGRIVGELYADDVCVGCELVRDGYAWVYRRYTNDAVLLRLEEEARAAGRGLWALPERERIAPWDWRRGVRAAPRPETFACGTKRFCREMESCAEARFHLEHCGRTELDGNGDGVPCNSLCRGH